MLLLVGLGLFGVLLLRGLGRCMRARRGPYLFGIKRRRTMPLKPRCRLSQIAFSLFGARRAAVVAAGAVKVA